MNINIGSEAIYNRYNSGPNETCINKANPASVTGKITQVEVFALLPIEINLRIATFIKIGTNLFSTRDYQDVGSVAASSAVTGVEINNVGSGYQINDVLRINQVADPESDKAEITVTTINGSGGITGIALTHAGILHHVENDVETLDGSGSGATVNVLTLTGKQIIITDIDVIAGDYIGFNTSNYGEDGGISTGLTGGQGIWSTNDFHIPCTSKSFSLTSNYLLSIGGEITPDTVPVILPPEEPGVAPSVWHHNGKTIIKCFLGVNAQPMAQKTYANIAGTLLVDDNDLGNFFGVRIPCSLTVTRNVVGACLNTSQGIRVTITVDEEDVSDSLVGNITIAHNLNYISTFSFNLGNPKYSPLVDSHIAVNSVVIITAYINGQAIKMFTGLLDETMTTYDGGYRLQINGRDYGKKLLDKTMTLISVQDSASNSTRGSIVKYLAGQAGQTNVNVPIGDKVTIDHSFQDQTVWDMVQKECAIEGWYVRFDENGVMKVKTRTIKTDTTDYPTPDWEYGEDKFIQLGLETSDKGIINKVIILGAIFEEETITITPADTTITPPEVDVPESEYTEDSIPISKSFVLGEVVTAWSYSSGGYAVTVSYDGPIKPSGYIFPKYQSYRFHITGSNIVDVTYSISGGATIQGGNNTGCLIYRDIQSTLEWIFTEKAFSITITIKTKVETAGGDVWIADNLPAEVAADTVVSTITYTQVKASVEDAASIALYGERKPNNEGTLEFPLAETEAQCKRIGENIILDSHRFIKQPDDEVPFNPKLIVGETVEFTDKKIGYDEDRYFGEEIIHTIDIDKEGKIKARTRTGCVYYA